MTTQIGNTVIFSVNIKPGNAEIFHVMITYRPSQSGDTATDTASNMTRSARYNADTGRADMEMKITDFTQEDTSIVHQIRAQNRNGKNSVLQNFSSQLGMGNANLSQMTAEGAFNHFINYGMKEGRQGSPDFNVKAYQNRYKDLRDAFGNDLPQYFIHFVTISKQEGRNGKTGSVGTAPGIEGDSSIWNGPNISSVFDANFYRNNYLDLNQLTAQEAFEHFINNGMKEARQARPDFNVNIYRQRYRDLDEAFGNDLPQYYLLFATIGKREGRSGKALNDETYHLKNI